MAAGDHLGDQFGYLVHRIGGETHIIATQGDKTAGALSITPDDDGDRVQRQINQYEVSQPVETEPSGQRRWSQGNMDSREPARVSWASARNPIVLRNMMGIAIHETRKVPVADYDLSPEGSRLSKAMSKRYGIQGHPLNPGMEPTFDSYIPERNEVQKYLEGPKLYAARHAMKAQETYGPESHEFDPHLGIWGEVRQVSSEEANAQGRSLKRRNPRGGPNGTQGVLFGPKHRA